VPGEATRLYRYYAYYAYYACYAYCAYYAHSPILSAYIVAV